MSERIGRISLCRAIVSHSAGEKVAHADRFGQLTSAASTMQSVDANCAAPNRVRLPYDISPEDDFLISLDHAAALF